MLIDCPKVSDGGNQESLTWLGEIAVAVNPTGVMECPGFVEVSDDTELVPSELIA